MELDRRDFLKLSGALTFTIGNATLRQLTVPSEILGRVTSSMRLLVWIAQPIAALLGGWLGSRAGLHRALWIGAIGALTTAPIPLLASGLLSIRRVPDASPGEDAGP